MLTQKDRSRIKAQVITQTLFRTLLRNSMIMGILCLTVALFSLDIFNIKKDTFSFTNYGFAVMGSYAAICFSWARNIPLSEDRLQKRINELAISSLYGGITFLLGSTFKYIYVLRQSDLNLCGADISPVLKYLCYICLTYALLMFCAVSIQILKVIDKETAERYRKMFTAKIAGEKLASQLEAELMETIDKYSKK